MTSHLLSTPFTRLVGCALPIQQAGMGLADPALAYAVAGAGALGMVRGVLRRPATLAASSRRVPVQV